MKSYESSAHAVAQVRLCASVLAIFATFPALAQHKAETVLSEVVVTAARFDTPAATLPFGVSVITKDDMARAGVATVNEALSKLLGVPGRVDLYGGGDYSLDLRGFGGTASSNQVVIVDGIRVNEADLGGTRLAGIAVNTVERIEVLRGSGSVLYGAGATGGVIVITTKAGRGVARKNAGEVYGAVGSFGLREARASATLAVGRFSLDAAGSQRQTNNHRDNFKSDAQGQTLKAQWATEGFRVGASHAYDSLDTRLPGSLTVAQYEANPRQTSSPDKSASIKNTRQTAFAKAEWGDWQLALDLGHRTKNLDSLTKDVVTYGYEIEADTLAARAKNEMQWGTLRNALTVGFDKSAWKRTVPGLFGSVSEQKGEALYAQDVVTLGAGTRLTVGYRSETIKQTDTYLAERQRDQSASELGLYQPVSDTFGVYGRLGNSFRLANIDELGFVLPGVTLQPQTSRDVELGGRWKYTNGRVELRYFRNTLTNELGYDPTVVNPNSFSGFGANVNFDPTLRQGVELETHHALSKEWGVQLNLGVKEATFTSGAHNGKNVPLVAGTTLAVRGNWTPVQGHAVNAGVAWVSSQNVDYDNACSMPSYVTADARYAYQWRTVEVSLAVNNLTNTKYYTQAFRCKAGVTSAIYPEAGRAFTAALRLSF